MPLMSRWCNAGVVRCQAILDTETIEEAAWFRATTEAAKYSLRVIAIPRLPCDTSALRCTITTISKTKNWEYFYLSLFNETQSRLITCDDKWINLGGGECQTLLTNPWHFRKMDRNVLFTLISNHMPGGMVVFSYPLTVILEACLPWRCPGLCEVMVQDAIIKPGGWHTYLHVVEVTYSPNLQITRSIHRQQPCIYCMPCYGSKILSIHITKARRRISVVYSA